MVRGGAREKKNISASAPKRKSLLAIPKHKLEEALTYGPPIKDSEAQSMDPQHRKKLPPSIKEHDDDDDVDTRILCAKAIFSGPAPQDRNNIVSYGSSVLGSHCLLENVVKRPAALTRPAASELGTSSCKHSRASPIMSL